MKTFHFWVLWGEYPGIRYGAPICEPCVVLQMTYILNSQTKILRSSVDLSR